MTPFLGEIIGTTLLILLGDDEYHPQSVSRELAALAPNATLVERWKDPELLELYEDLRRQKKGVGVAALVDGVCQGCHEKLSAVELDRLKRTEGIKRCEYCRRILIL